MSILKHYKKGIKNQKTLNKRYQKWNLWKFFDVIKRNDGIIWGYKIQNNEGIESLVWIFKTTTNFEKSSKYKLY